MNSLPLNFRALVLGSSGGIGAAMMQLLHADPRCALALGLHRQSEPAIDYSDESSIAKAAAGVAHKGPFHLIVVATGVLHTSTQAPEKKLADLNYEQLADTFTANTFGPALVLRHFVPLFAPQRSIFGVLSAKVGSIGDNRLGGWYSYRASKAALNMLIKTASIEAKRTHPGAVLIALHPGTVSSKLSAPFRGGEIGRPPVVAARDMLNAMDTLGTEDSGGFYSYNGEQLPW